MVDLALSPAERRAEFLMAIAQHGSYSAAARACGIDFSTQAAWRREDPAFAAACLDARAEAYEMLQDSLYQRAMKSSDIAAFFLLKGEWPEKYRDNAKIDIETRNLNVSVQIADLSEADQASILRLTLGAIEAGKRQEDDDNIIDA